MCDCPEIQEKWVIAKPDVVVDREYEEVAYWLLTDDDFRDAIKNPGFLIYLPRQDQIQEMMGWEKDFQAPIKIRLFHSWIFDGSDRACYCQQFDSLEQLWLAFYMYEKHEKIWKDDKWIKS